MYIINDDSTPQEIRQAANALEDFFLDTLHKHHPGQEDLAFDDPYWP